jgi:hypothetical protein
MATDCVVAMEIRYKNMAVQSEVVLKYLTK